MNYGASHAREIGRPRLDLATTQAVVALTVAIRNARAIEREDLRAKSEIYRRAHARRLASARVCVDIARRGLEELLEAS